MELLGSDVATRINTFVMIVGWSTILIFGFHALGFVYRQIDRLRE